MLRKVSVSQLRPGMYVNHIPANWFAHPFWRTRFQIRSAREIERLHDAGISEVLIDTRRGLDVAEAPPRRAYQTLEELDRRLVEVARERREAQRHAISLDEERRRVRFLEQEAIATLDQLMDDVREGRRLDIGRTEPVIAKLMDSVRRHPDALIPLLQIKEHDTYRAKHSLSVAAMTVAVGQTVGLGDDELLQTTQAALLQDVGTARISERVLNKATPLTDLEFLHVRSHVDKSQAILEAAIGVSDLTVEIAVQHHERVDGTGYPYRLTGEQVLPNAQIASLVDVYDALTADRPYHRRLEPAAALSQLYGQAGGEFREDLLQALVKTLGVYPVGSLVRLDSGHLAVVVEQHRDNLLKPVVRIVYNIARQEYIRPQLLDLARRLEPPAIVGVESYAKWGIDPRRWRPE